MVLYKELHMLPRDFHACIHLVIDLDKICYYCITHIQIETTRYYDDMCIA